MPLLRMHAVEPGKIRSISTNLVTELQEILQCPRDYFSLEAVQSVFIGEGELLEGSAVVEVSWFDRGQEIQDRTAQIITKYIHSIGYSGVDVIFIPLEKSKYYENGVHF